MTWAVAKQRCKAAKQTCFGTKHVCFVTKPVCSLAKRVGAGTGQSRFVAKQTRFAMKQTLGAITRICAETRQVVSVAKQSGDAAKRVCFATKPIFTTLKNVHPCENSRPEIGSSLSWRACMARRLPRITVLCLSTAGMTYDEWSPREAGWVSDVSERVRVSAADLSRLKR